MTSTDELIKDFFEESHNLLDGKTVNPESLKVSKDTDIKEKPQIEKVLEQKIQEIEVPEKKKKDKLFWFKWLAWMEELKEELKENVILPLKNKELFNQFKVWIPNWILLYWPPWCWKTFIVWKLSEELEVSLIKHSMADIWSSYQHETTTNIKKIFDDAKKNAPCILFLDEIDSFTWKRDSLTTDSKSEELAQFLQELNNISAFDIIVIGATNRPDEIDSAIMRTWRFDSHIYVWPPDIKAREELFKLYTKTIWRPVWKIDYKELAMLTNDYTSSDIETICDKVSRELASKSLWKKKISVINTKDIIDIISITHSSLLNVDMSVFENFRNKWK